MRLRPGLLAGLCLAASLAAQAAPPPPQGAPLSWTDVADLSIASPVIVRATARRVVPLGRRSAPDVPAGEVRVLVEADLVSVLKAPGMLPARARWLWQGPAGPRGRPPLAAGDELLLFLVPELNDAPDAVPGDAYRLANAAGQLRWSADLEATVRTILAEVRRPDAPVAIRSITAGFHVPGTVEGESESQFFLATEDGRPMTLVVLRRPGAAPSVRLATGDLIDESASEIRPQTLVWRALACTMPPALPPDLDRDPGLAADFAEMRRQIGACDRRL